MLVVDAWTTVDVGETLLGVGSWQPGVPPPPSTATASTHAAAAVDSIYSQSQSAKLPAKNHTRHALI